MSTPRRSRAYGLLLRVLPRDLRRAFGPDMEQLFEDQRREARAAGRGEASVWASAVGDLASAAAREWGTRAREVVVEILREGARMDGWKQDVRFGVRSLLRRPGFTAAGVGTLALGIGATLSIFTVVNGVLLTPLDFPDPDRVVTIWSRDTETGERGSTIDHPDVRAWQAAVPGLSVAGYATTRPTLTGIGRPEVVHGVDVTDGLMTLLGYTPALGRDLTAEDDVPSGPRVVVVSHEFWTNRLGADPDVLGRTLTLGGEPWEIVGVAPAGFSFPEGSELWLPRRHEIEGCGHGCRFMRGVGRVHADATLEEVQSRLDAVSAGLAAEYPDSHRDARTEIEPMLETEVADIEAGLWILFGAVGMVLLIACANVANLMLVRGAQRRPEVALRMSLGASRTRIVRQLLTEALLLAAVAGAIGLALSFWGTSALVALAPDDLPRLGEASIDRTVITFALILVVAVTSLFGTFPAVQLSNSDLRGGIGTGTRGGRGDSTGWSRSILVTGEVALSLALLLGAGLLLRTLGEIRSVEYGFAVEGSERFRLSLPDSRYDSLAVSRFLGELEGRIAVVPGVRAVGSSFGVPLASGNISTSIRFLDRPEVPPADRPSMAIRPASPGFLEASGTSLIRGRWFTDDDVYGGEGVAVLNQAAVDRFYGGEDPIGRRIGADVSWSFADTPPMTIVGVVGDVRSWSATEDPPPALYLPNAQFGASSVYVWLGLASGTSTAMPAVRAILDELDSELAITNVTRLEEVIAAEQRTPAFFLTLLSVFSGLALSLAAIGLYGVVAYTVSRRTREIGIRIALGAKSDQVVRMVARQSVKPVVSGVIVGLGLAVLGGRTLESLLFGVEPNDPLTLATVSILLVAVTSAAMILPAWRASRIPPGRALRID